MLAVLQRVVFLCAGFTLAIAVASCGGSKDPDRPGTVERAGRAVDRGVEKTVEAVGDATITTKVKAALALHKDIEARRVNVDTADGIVTLRGRVPTGAVKQEAGRVASTVAGVKEVVNLLETDG